MQGAETVTSQGDHLPGRLVQHLLALGRGHGAGKASLEEEEETEVGEWNSNRGSK